MVTIFAGRDREGVVRYLNEVPSGLACACTCMACGSALVAKKGAINDWHFAHESGQTNPQCQVGAENLLRELALECVRAFGLPAHIEPCSMWAGHQSQRVVWAAEIVAIRWSPTPDQRQAATLELRGGAVAALVVLVDEDDVAGRFRPGASPALIVSVPMLPAAGFRSKQDLTAHIWQHMSARWHALPDTDGKVQAAKDELQRRVEAEVKGPQFTPSIQDARPLKSTGLALVTSRACPRCRAAATWHKSGRPRPTVGVGPETARKLLLLPLPRWLAMATV